MGNARSRLLVRRRRFGGAVVRGHRRRRRPARHIGGRHHSFTSSPPTGRQRHPREIEYIVEAPGDDDGISDAVENAGPNGGDGNSDGTPDSSQDNVTSLPSFDRPVRHAGRPRRHDMVDVSAIDPERTAHRRAATRCPTGCSASRSSRRARHEATVRIYTPSAGDDHGLRQVPRRRLVGAAGRATCRSTRAASGSTSRSSTAASVTTTASVNGSIVDPGGVVLLADTQPPVVDCAVQRRTWSATDVSLSCTASDTGSGSGRPGRCVVLADDVGGGRHRDRQRLDGHRAGVRRRRQLHDGGPIGGIKVDKSAPSVTIASPPVPKYQRAVVDRRLRMHRCRLGPGHVRRTRRRQRRDQHLGRRAEELHRHRRPMQSATARAAPSRTRWWRPQTPRRWSAPTWAVAGLNDVGFQTASVAISGSFADADGPGPYTASVRWTPTSSFVPMPVCGSQFAGSVHVSLGRRRS